MWRGGGQWLVTTQLPWLVHAVTLECLSGPVDYLLRRVAPQIPSGMFSLTIGALVQTSASGGGRARGGEVREGEN